MLYDSYYLILLDLNKVGTLKMIKLSEVDRLGLSSSSMISLRQDTMIVINNGERHF